MTETQTGTTSSSRKPDTEQLPGESRFWDPAASCAVWALKTVVRFLPLSLFEPICSALGTLYCWLSSRDRRVLRQNAVRVLGLEASSPELRDFERAVFRHQMLFALEWIRSARTPSLIDDEAEGLEELQGLLAQARDASKGALIVTAHLGSWEGIAHFHGVATGKTLYALAKAAPLRPVSRLLRDLRRSHGCEVLWAGDRPPLRQMLRLLRGGEALAFVMDQKPQARRGPVVQFFGHDAEFVAGPASVALRTDCDVIALFCLQEPRSSSADAPFRYRLLVQKVETQGLDEHQLTQRFADVIEAAIREAPEQWAWNYRRWYFDD